MLAIILLMVAGMRSWPAHHGSVQDYASEAEKASKDFTKKDFPGSAKSDQAKVSTLSLDAVITLAISYDFSHYFYFLPQPDWHFVSGKAIVKVAFEEPFFFFSYFHRIFGRTLVTNAP
ncbi:hypothetical protein FEM33_00105 [Dyadobacter flavalbus]|uniref:Uncharacterized protein n=1 Tax=Dyadobacter flavalbus TaxID=2579942 RepID=A0A5M8R1Z0_9BACT|nr:hypothetical protein [Dyadobacter flavalbus]KAA6441711.1 hypothetical protein FEM33_00105 [Dyadobacter flavalbus]